MILPLAVDAPRAKVAQGVLEGAMEDGVRSFKGVPFAAPPVGPLRWREPMPAKPWIGVRDAKAFGLRPMQLPLYSDMMFRSPGVGENCLTLNVWAPEKGKRLPVLVYFYGGGFQAGSADEKRYDGAAMARRGIVSITVNYRLGLFGFFAHPELTKESPFHASGDYGLMDQAAALQWVRKNVGAFGGDPKRITIGGESAGSFSVSAQMASPLARNLIAGAIGESGGALGPAPDLGTAERAGEAYGLALGAPTLAALRAMPAQALLDATKAHPARFGLIVDGHFLPKPVADVYAAGEQAHVPLLAGWNAQEGGSVLGNAPASPEAFAAAVRRLYPARADDVLRVYSGDPQQAAVDLAGDRFIGFGTWKWTALHAGTGGKPVYRYYYTQPRPGEPGAVHSAEIEYALGNLDVNPRYPWTDADRATSKATMAYWEAFVKTGSPNAPGLPNWPTQQSGATMRLGPAPAALEEWRDDRYSLLDVFAAGR